MTDAERAERIAALRASRAGQAPSGGAAPSGHRAMNSRIAVAGAATASMLALMGLMSRAADAESMATDLPPPEQSSGRQIVYVYQSTSSDPAKQVLQTQVAATPAPRIIQATPRQVTATRSSGSR